MQTSANSNFHHSVEWPDFNQLFGLGCYLSELATYFKLDQIDTSLCNADILQALAVRFTSVELRPQFRSQSFFDQELRYYEQVIDQDNVIPTREQNWHDFFNGLIWCQFPRSKRLLNQMHARDIKAYGLNPRTPLRNRITHFDECGLVLVATSHRALALTNELAKHQWQDVLLDAKDLWHNELIPVVFGHANLEMLLNPYPQLTAKWCVVDMSDGDYQHWDIEGFQNLDTRLEKELQQQPWLYEKGQLKPLPLVGIPGWECNQTQAFYAQTDIFRPKREKRS